MKQLEIIEVPDKELRQAGEDNVFNLYQGDLFRDYIVKGVVRDTERRVTNYLVYRRG